MKGLLTRITYFNEVKAKDSILKVELDHAASACGTPIHSENLCLILNDLANDCGSRSFGP
jgi:hypothetical protein